MEKDTNGELFIGLVGATGTDLRYVSRTLEKEIIGLGAKPRPVVIELSVMDALHHVSGFQAPPESPPLDHIETQMDNGDRFRERVERPDAVIRNTLRAIRAQRQEFHLRRMTEDIGTEPRIVNETDAEREELGPDEVLATDLDRIIPGGVYIIHSLKRPEEVHLLRNVYDTAFLVVACYSSTEERRNMLHKRFERFQLEIPENLDSQIDHLIQRDHQDRKKQKYGQNVQDTFPMADYFVGHHTETLARRHLERLVRMLYWHPYSTPTDEEFHMKAAKCAAFRSADLSRQVGAVVTTRTGDLVSLGYNEVPRFGGGVYKPSDGDHDARDFQLGHDTNSRWRAKLIFEMIRTLENDGWFTLQPDVEEEYELASYVIKILKNADARVTNLIEFLRPIHAEMGAIAEAARRGLSLNGCVLYCTTYPCHECTRLIVASGIERVVYIDPYPKSLADEMYKDSVIVDPTDDEVLGLINTSKLIFQQYTGIAPRAYTAFFNTPEDRRKGQHGQAYNEGDIVYELRPKSLPEVYLPNEQREAGILHSIMEAKNMSYQET